MERVGVVVRVSAKVQVHYFICLTWLPDEKIYIRKLLCFWQFPLTLLFLKQKLLKKTKQNKQKNIKNMFCSLTKIKCSVVAVVLELWLSCHYLIQQMFTYWGILELQKVLWCLFGILDNLESLSFLILTTLILCSCIHLNHTAPVEIKRKLKC